MFSATGKYTENQMTQLKIATAVSPNKKREETRLSAEKFGVKEIGVEELSLVRKNFLAGTDASRLIKSFSNQRHQ